MSTPGFAGYYLDGNHRLIVLTSDTTAIGAAASQVARSAILGEMQVLPARAQPLGLAVRHVRFNFRSLSDYRDFVTDSVMAAVPGVIWDDVDEVGNTVTVGLLRSNFEAVQSTVLQRLQKQGIPLEAIRFTPSDGLPLAVAHVNPATEARAFLSTTILESPNPDTLGAGLAWYNFDRTKVCTVGAVLDSGTTRMWLTASHCTQHIFQRDGDTTRLFDGTYIGVERDDPAATRSCTFIPVHCWHHRSSDAALMDFSFLGLGRQRRGVIARPSSRDSISPSQIGTGVARDTSIDSSNPWLFVSAQLDASLIFVGQEVDHVGVRSGWTYGTVTTTCVDVSLRDAGDNRIYCEDQADGMYSRQGDSGGPVFIWDGADGAELIGDFTGLVCTCHTYWGGSDLEGQGTYFSTWSGNVADLGDIDATSGYTLGAPSISGALHSDIPTISWSAVAASNTAYTTQYRVYRTMWDASTYTWSEQDHRIGTTTATSYLDLAIPRSLYSYAGGSEPNPCQYSYAEYYVVAYNSGLQRGSNVLYFTSDEDGPNPDQIKCQ